MTTKDIHKMWWEEFKEVEKKEEASEGKPKSGESKLAELNAIQ